MSFWKKVFGRNVKNRQIIKEPENEIIKALPDELMVQEKLNNNDARDKTLNNKDSP